MVFTTEWLVILGILLLIFIIVGALLLNRPDQEELLDLYSINEQRTDSGH